MATRSLALMITVFLMFLAAGNITWSQSLVEHNWRKPHWSLLLAWIPNFCLAAWSLYWPCLMLFESFVTIVGQLATLIICLFIIPVLSIATAFLFRRLRSEVLVAYALVLPLLLVFAGIGVLIFIYRLPPDDEFHGTEFTLLIAGIGLIQTAPLIWALVTLFSKRLWGNRPAKLITCLACEYDLTGTAQADQTLCPECGAEISPAQQAWIKAKTTTGINAPSTQDGNHSLQAPR